MPPDELEFWPDYGGALLWDKQGKAIPLDTLPMSADLRARLEAWVTLYDDTRLPMEGSGDTAWLDLGTRLLAEVQETLAPAYDVVVSEPWWGIRGVT